MDIGESRPGLSGERATGREAPSTMRKHGNLEVSWWLDPFCKHGVHLGDANPFNPCKDCQALTALEEA